MEVYKLTDNVYSILAGMQCLRELSGWEQELEFDGKVVIHATTTFGRNGHGRQSDYLYTISKTVERLEMINCSCTIDYVFDTLDDVGHVNWKIYA